MKEQLDFLVKLQEADDDIDALRKNLERIPAIIEKLRRSYLEKEKAVEDLKANIEESSRERRSAERELEAHESKITELKEKQFMVKTNKEYQAFVHQIEKAEVLKGDIEDKILTLLEKGAAVDKEIESEEERLKQEKEVMISEEKRLLSEQADLEEKISKEEKEKAGIVNNISEENLKTYSRLREFWNGKAVTAAIGGICQGCHMSLPPQKFQDVKKNEKIETCNQCKRILYYMELKVEEPAAGKEG